MCDQPPEGGGPPKLANLITFKTTEDPQVVWSLGDVKVSAIRSTHIPGHSSYRVETPAGSVVIGGDATNDVLTQPRAHSASDQVELLAKGVDVIVHSTMHPIMGPDRDSGMPSEVFNRQSSTDLGAMAQRVNAKHLVLTHLGPSIGAMFQGALQGARWCADRSRFQEGCGSGRIHRQHHRGHRSGEPANSREVSRASYGTLPSASGALATIGFRRWSLECRERWRRRTNAARTLDDWRDVQAGGMRALGKMPLRVLHS